MQAEAEGSIAVSPAPVTKNATAEMIKSFIAGGFGGVAAVLVGHPFDLTKTRLQTAPPGTYTGALDVVRKALARDGMTGSVAFFLNQNRKGFAHDVGQIVSRCWTAVVGRDADVRGLVLGMLVVELDSSHDSNTHFSLVKGYDLGKKLVLSATPNRTSNTLTIPELAAAGFFSAVPTTLVAAPVERAKVLLQVQGQGGSEQKYKGMFDVFRALYKEGGVRSIFRGSFATLLRDGPGSAAYFAAYEVAKKALTPEGSDPSQLNLGAIVVAGGTAGVAMWSIAIPPDVRQPCPDTWENMLTHMVTGAQVEVAVGADGHVLGSVGLCAEDYRSGRRWCAVEGIRPGDGSCAWLICGAIAL